MKEIVFAVCAIVYMLTAFGLTILNMFVTMPMIGQLMLMYAPAVLIVGYLIYVGIILFGKGHH